VGHKNISIYDFSRPVPKYLLSLIANYHPIFYLLLDSHKKSSYTHQSQQTTTDTQKNVHNITQILVQQIEEYIKSDYLAF
jgi:lauroyl/myristoyl acyltransferase